MNEWSAQIIKKRERFWLDPRTKLILVIVEATVVLATTGGDELYWFRIFFMVLPFLLLLTAGNYKVIITGLAFLTVVNLVERFYFDEFRGIFASFLLIISMLLLRFLPTYLMGAYVIGSTKISEFKAAMEKIHMPDTITIPMCVMFRFFPTVKDEWTSINSAMKMRGIKLGGGKASEILEYRLVPMLSCCAKIGEELSAAAITRGLGIEKKRTNVCRIGFGIFDYVILGVVLIMVVVWAFGVIK